MIAIESFKKFRFEDFIAILALAVLYFFIANLINLIKHPQYSFILALLFLVILMAFSVYLIRKAGNVVLFCLVASFLTVNIPNFDITGAKKILIFVFLGLIFELVFLILKLEIKFLPLDVVLGAGIAAASLPILMGLFLSFNILTRMYASVLNIIFLNFLIGIAGAIIAFLVWYKLKLTKFIMRYEYMR